MESLIFKPQSPVNDRLVGYSCQTVLARQVNEFLHPGTFYCWFSIQFNPTKSGNSSNPCWLYQTLSHALAENDVNDAKIKDLKTTLMDIVSRELESRGATTRSINNAIITIAEADIGLFRPEVWRIFLRKVEGRVSSGHQYSEERKITDLKWQEFDVIIE